MEEPPIHDCPLSFACKGFGETERETNACKLCHDRRKIFYYEELDLTRFCVVGTAYCGWDNGHRQGISAPAGAMCTSCTQALAKISNLDLIRHE